MCGIIGYVGPDECSDILLDGLARLEYQGRAAWWGRTSFLHAKYFFFAYVFSFCIQIFFLHPFIKVFEVPFYTV